jgi:murein hydrolase activator
VRGLLVLRALAHGVETQAEALRREQAAVDQAERALAAEAPRLTAARDAQADAAARLDQAFALADAGRRQAEGEAAAAASRATAMAVHAETLQALLARLEAERRAEEARAAAARTEAAKAMSRRGRMATARQQVEAAFSPGRQGLSAGAHPHGQLVLPVIGSVTRAWGQPTEAGPAAGLTLRPPPGARVIAPCSGQVVFAAPFRSYGKLLILDCGGGVSVILAGFDRLDGKLGEAVRVGDPIGVMPDWTPGAGGKRPELYLELRRHGEPVDPQPWMRSTGRPNAQMATPRGTL